VGVVEALEKSDMSELQCPLEINPISRVDIDTEIL
jgi:hypothetical protein